MTPDEEKQFGVTRTKPGKGPKPGGVQPFDESGGQPQPPAPPPPGPPSPPGQGGG